MDIQTKIIYKNEDCSRWVFIKTKRIEIQICENWSVVRRERSWLRFVLFDTYSAPTWWGWNFTRTAKAEKAFFSSPNPTYVCTDVCISKAEIVCVHLGKLHKKINARSQESVWYRSLSWSVLRFGCYPFPLTFGTKVTFSIHFISSPILLLSYTCLAIRNTTSPHTTNLIFIYTYMLVVVVKANF